MPSGDNARVRASGCRAGIIDDQGNSRYRVLFCPEPAVDALDSSTIDDEDDAGGIYDAEHLEHIP
jgi:hypothetical protein